MRGHHIPILIAALTALAVLLTVEFAGILGSGVSSRRGFRSTDSGGFDSPSR